MEFLQGKSLADLLEKEGAMTPERVAYIMEQVCGSLEEAHGRGIVHRDLKPDNVVLVERAGKKDFVKVLDFGIAKRSKEEDKNEQKLTQQGMVLGTPPYMSPEQFTGQPIDARSDIYSLGVMAYEMLTGKLPFKADTAWEWATQHMTQPPIPIESLAEGHARARGDARRDPARAREVARRAVPDREGVQRRVRRAGRGTSGTAADDVVAVDGRTAEDRDGRSRSTSAPRSARRAAMAQQPMGGPMMGAPMAFGGRPAARVHAGRGQRGLPDACRHPAAARSPQAAAGGGRDRPARRRGAHRRRERRGHRLRAPGQRAAPPCSSTNNPPAPPPNTTVTAATTVEPTAPPTVATAVPPLNGRRPAPRCPRPRRHHRSLRAPGQVQRAASACGRASSAPSVTPRRPRAGRSRASPRAGTRTEVPTTIGGGSGTPAVVRVAASGTKHARHRASYSAAPPTKSCPSAATRRCERVAAPPHRAQTAWSLVTYSATARSAGIDAERPPSPVLIEPRRDDADPARRERLGRVDDRRVEELRLVDAHDQRRRQPVRQPSEELLRARDRDGIRVQPLVRDDLHLVVPVVDPRLEEHAPAAARGARA